MTTVLCVVLLTVSLLVGNIQLGVFAAVGEGLGFDIQYAILVSAIHSQEGCVLLELLFKDNYYAELAPGEHIKLTFTLPRQDSETRTFIIYAEGHYYTIEN